MWVSFCQDDPGFATFRVFASAPSSSPGRSNSQTAAPVFRARIRDQTGPVHVRCEMPEIGPGKGAGQIVAPAARRVDAFIADVRGRPARDELSFVRFARRGAGDGNVASPLPALMPVTELVPVPAPGEIAQVRSIVPAQVDVGAKPADELFQPAVG